MITDLTVETPVLVVSGASALIRGDDAHHLVSGQLLPLQCLVSVSISEVSLDPLQVLRSLGTVATHEGLH